MAKKKNETQAAIEYKNKFIPALKSQDYPTAKKFILSAKGFIDLAAANDETKDREKTLYYKSEIYIGMFTLAQMQPNDTELAANVTEANIKEAHNALKAGYAVRKKYKSDFDEAIFRARKFFDNTGNALYNAEKFKEAASMYKWQAQFSETGGSLDSAAVYYFAVCSEKATDYTSAADSYYKLAKAGFRGAATYYQAADAYKKNEQFDKAKAVVAEGREQYPNDRDLLMMLVSISIDSGDKEGAEAALQNAIKADPNNKTLYYIIGTIYMDLKQNEKAEEALNKAVELNPRVCFGPVPTWSTFDCMGW